MVLQRVSLITIGCHDFALLRRFYHRIGWEETDVGYSDYAVFKTAGVLLFLIKKVKNQSGLLL